MPDSGELHIFPRAKRLLAELSELLGSFQDQPEILNKKVRVYPALLFRLIKSTMLP